MAILSMCYWVACNFVVVVLCPLYDGWIRQETKADPPKSRTPKQKPWVAIYLCVLWVACLIDEWSLITKQGDILGMGDRLENIIQFLKVTYKQAMVTAV